MKQVPIGFSSAHLHTGTGDCLGDLRRQDRGARTAVPLHSGTLCIGHSGRPLLLYTSHRTRR
eukprot:5484168-Pyramimonas_sp.AAC.1